MALFEKLVGIGGIDATRIPVHQFGRALSLWAMGIYTRAGLISEFNLTLEDEADLDFIKARSDASTLSAVEFAFVVEGFLLHGEYRDGLFGMKERATFVAAVNGL